MNKPRQSRTELMSQYFSPALIKPKILNKDVVVRPGITFRVTVAWESDADDESFGVALDIYKGEDWTEKQVEMNPLVSYSVIPFGCLSSLPNIVDIANATGGIIEVIENIAEHALARCAVVEIESDLNSLAKENELVLKFYLRFGVHVLCGELPVEIGDVAFEIRGDLLRRLRE